MTKTALCCGFSFGKQGDSISGGVVRAVIDCRYAISEERSEASLGANTKGEELCTYVCRYFVSSTPSAVLANIRALVPYTTWNLVASTALFGAPASERTK